jgi:hypothetical protein
MIAGQRATTKRAADKSKQKTNHCALKTGERRPAERAVSNQKGKDDADKERTSKEEEDYNNNEEEDCVAANATAAAAAVPAAATAAATAGRHHASSAAAASDQAVAAVAAAWRSGLRRCMVAAAADSRMPSLTPVFLCFLSVCFFQVAQNTMFHGSFPPEFLSPEFRTKLILPWNDLIPTCVLRNWRNSAEFHGFQKLRPGRNRNTKRNAHPRVGGAYYNEKSHRGWAGMIQK